MAVPPNPSHRRQPHRPGVLAHAVRRAIAADQGGQAPANAATQAESLPTVTVSSGQEAKGTAADGYREDRVSNVGPWQGRTLLDTPYSITVFSEEFIENLQAGSADQVYRVTPTLQQTRAQYENNQPTVNLRGFSLYGSYRDGVPQDFFGHLVTMEDTERVEVFNGLSGFLYGSGNVGGLVNYVSKRSTSERLNDITVTSLGHKAWYVHGDFGGKFGPDGRFGYRLNVAKQDGDTVIKGQTIDRELYSLVLDWQPRNDLYLQVSGTKMNYDILGSQAAWSATAATRLPASALRNDLSYGPRWTRRYYDTDRYAAQMKWDVGQAASIRAVLQSNSVVRNTSYPSPTNTINSPTTYTQTIAHVFAPGVNDVYTSTDDRRGAVYADFRFDTGAVSHKLTAGYQYGNNHIQSWANAAPLVVAGTFLIDDPQYIDRPTVRPSSRGAERNSVSIRRSLLVGDDITFNDHWSALVGASHTQITSSGYDKSALTPTLSLLFKPVPDLTTYVSYMEALESGGTAADTYQGAEVVNKGEIFGPLKSKQVEIGAKYSWNGMLLSGALFQIDKGLQYYDVRDPSRPVYVQDGRQVHKGVEFTAIGKITRDVSLLGGFTWLDPKVRQQKQNPLLEGKRPTLVSDKLFKVRAEYAVPAVQGLSVSAGFNHASASYADTMNTDRLPAYTVYDVGARYRFGPAGHPITIRLDITNLFDRHYWANGATLGDPRTVVLSANYRF
ncbi:TonB-dependent siderophore receptor [Pseudorhodoferax sp.]|uniref:TonB-dependent siderophore receptor n=1 Tax=Pseudorhodoferax sp. TaxID=1993553 RepID=UPI0039E44D9F